MKRCFIIGNGPSQNNVDLGLLKDEITFGVNDIQLRFPEFYPTYWVIADKRYIRHYRDIIESDHPTTVLSGFGMDGDDTTMREGVVEFHGGRYQKPFTTGNIIYVCIQLAWQRGFRDINLIGVDTLENFSYLEGHFSPDYASRLDYKDVEEKRANSSVPPNLTKKSFHIARDFILDNGGELWDVSDGGTGMFPKRSLKGALL